MTPRQELVTHLGEAHAYHRTKGNHTQLTLAHRAEHRRTLTHSHKPDGWATGGEQIEVKISLSPPKNPSASRNGDRNWVLHIAHLKDGHGWRFELPGTSVNFPDEAKVAANKLLGWEADWKVKGWGWEAVDGPWE